MGKLLDRLNKQLKTDFKKDAEDCLILYNYLKETTGHVWESNWNPLVNVEFIGKYPYQRKFKPTFLGYTVLKGLEINVN